MGPPPEPIETLGGDKIFRSGESIVIESAAPMPGWEARPYRPVEVLYRDQSFRLADVQERPPNRRRYRLDPWPDDYYETVTETIVYDARFVEERDQARTALAVAGWVNLVLTPIEPLLGFLPGNWLAYLRDRFGIHADRAHGLSVFIEFVAGLCVLIAIRFGLFGRNDGAGLLCGLVILADAVMRYDRRLGEDPYLYAPLEWLFKRR